MSGCARKLLTRPSRVFHEIREKTIVLYCSHYLSVVSKAGLDKETEPSLV